MKKSTPKKIALEKTTCEICDFECGDIEKLNEHQVEKHQDGKHKRCSYCDFKSMGWLKLKCHIDGKHPEHGKKKHSCNLCGKGFIFKVWQYGLWSFQIGGTKLERFLLKNQHTKEIKAMYFIALKEIIEF